MMPRGKVNLAWSLWCAVLEAAVGEVVLVAGAELRPVRVEAATAMHVRDVDLLHEVAHLLDALGDEGDPLPVDDVGRVRVHRRRHAADEVRLEVRVLAAEDRVDLDDLALPVERLEVVRHRQQVGLGRQLVGRVAPVAVGEQAQLAGVDELLDPRLDALEVGLGARGGQAEMRLRRARRSAAGSALSAPTTSTQSSACRW